ncbi:hypothetical protein Q5752_000833 [Cryptotrichosporon argae]
MPREDYATPVLYTLSTLSRVLRYVLFGTVFLSISSLAAFEALHAYVESSIPPSRSSADDSSISSSASSSAYGWEDENEPWTGGSAGGTDPRLGWRARHALRGAWIAWHWGAGGGGTIGKDRGVHPDLDLGRRRMIGEPGMGPGVNRVDRGYELADEYVDVTISQARARGLVFPPTLSGARSPGPPADTPTSPVQGDPTVLDLLSLKAAIQERLNTPSTLARAKELYETVLVASVRGAGAGAGASGAAKALHLAREMRAAKKVGDLCARMGDAAEAAQWWSWGLARAGVHPPQVDVVAAVAEAKAKTASWFSWKHAAKPMLAAATVPAEAVPTLAPPVQRATTALLLSISAHLSQSRSTLALAHSTQMYALDHLPTTPFSAPTASTAPSALDALWLAQRRALLLLHSAAVSHALGNDAAAAAAAAEADDASDALLRLVDRAGGPAVTKQPALVAPFEQLERDARATAAEAAYTRGILLERGQGADAVTAVPAAVKATKAAAGIKTAASDEEARLEAAHECLERALALTGDEARDEAERGEEWARYWRAHLRVLAKLETAVEVV